MNYSLCFMLKILQLTISVLGLYVMMQVKSDRIMAPNEFCESTNDETKKVVSLNFETQESGSIINPNSAEAGDFSLFSIHNRVCAIISELSNFFLGGAVFVDFLFFESVQIAIKKTKSTNKIINPKPFFEILKGLFSGLIIRN